MLSFLSLNKIALISVFSICAFAGAYAADIRGSNTLARDERGVGDERSGVDRGGDDQRMDDQRRDDRVADRGRDASRYQDSRYNGEYGGYGGGYGGAVIYPQNPQSPYEAFPDDAEFDSIYEKNAHPPR